MTSLRNRFEYDEWVLEKIDDFSIIAGFDCGNHDLNDFFNKDAERYRNQLLAQTYCFYPIGETANESLAFVALCNDSVVTKTMRRTIKDKIPHHKRHYPSYPAVKIARLGVTLLGQGKNVGTALITTIKSLFVRDNRTGCRFITVDAYNTATTLNFYSKNGFVRTVKENSNAERDEDDTTVSLIFDLMRIYKTVNQSILPPTIELS